MITIKKTTNFGNSSPQRRKERKGIIFRKWMLEISEKPCDFVYRSRDRFETCLYSFLPLSPPLEGEKGGGRPLRLCGGGEPLPILLP